MVVLSDVKSARSLLPLLPKVIVWNLIGIPFMWLILNHGRVAM